MKPLLFILGVLSVLGSARAQWRTLQGAEGTAATVSVREDGPSGVVIEFIVGGYYLTTTTIDNKTFSVLSVPKASVFLENGYPELPRISRSITIPDESKMKLEIIKAQYETTYVGPVTPSKGSLSRSVDPKKVPYTLSEFYKADTLWPANIVELSQPFILRDVRGITIHFNLFRHNAVKQQLIICKRLLVRVFADGIDNVNVKTGRKGAITRDFLQIYERFFLNFSWRDANVLGKTSYTGVGETGRMLIIAADDFYSSVMPLRDWRTRRGNRTVLIKCSDIGTTWQAVKSYIQSMYDSSASVTYILLVGDGTNVPSKGVPYPGTYTNPTDPTYALLAGADPYPDAFVSRISAENVDQVDNQVMRILQYERNPISGSWFQQACGIASHEGYPGTADTTRCNWLRADLLSYGYSSVDKLYDITSAEPIANAINAGRGPVNFIGHGSLTGWGFNSPYVSPLFSVSDVQGHTNAGLIPFVFSVACQVGSFSEISTCFAESWLRAGTKEEPDGAIGFYGSSIDQPWLEPTVAQAEAVDLLVADAKMTIGGLCFNGSCKMIESYPSTGPAVFNTWHIFGDAATHVWTGVPVNLASATVTDNGSSVTVNAGVGGSSICVSSGNNGASYWNRIDDVSSYTFNTSVRPLYITVTKHNYSPYIAVTGGTFSSNEYWFGPTTVLGYVTFNSGVTPQVITGSSLLFGSSSTRLLINGGHLYVNGTSASHVTIDGQGYYRSGMIYPLILVASGGTANIQYADFKNAAYQLSLWTNSGSSSVQNSAFTNFGYSSDSKALAVYSASGPVTISNNTFTGSNSQGTGIYSYNTGTGVTISSNSITSAGTGIRRYSSNAFITYNTIHNNANYGIQADYVQSAAHDSGNDIRSNGTGLSLNSSSPWVMYNTIIQNGLNVLVNGGAPNFAGPVQLRGYNTIAYAGSPLLRAQNYGFPYLGYDYDGGYNSLYETDLPHLWAVNHSMVWADNNYWDGAPSYYADGTSSVTVMNPLPSNPNPDPLAKSMATSSNGGAPLNLGDATVDTTGEGALRSAVGAALSGDVATAKSGLEALIQSGSAKHAALALAVYYDLCKARWGKSEALGDMESGLYTVLQNVSAEPVANRLRPFALRLLARDAAVSANDSAANIYRMQILTDYPKSVHELPTMYDLLVYYVHAENNVEKAREILDKMKALYPEDRLTYMARAELGEKVDFWALGKQEFHRPVDPPAAFALSKAFPNPFNPSTTFEYALPEPAKVTLTVYDLLGREVSTIRDGYEDAGYDAAVWDARNVASGVYYTRFVVTDLFGLLKFSKVDKLLLVK